MSSNNHVLIVGSIAFDDLEMPTGIYENVWGGAATYASIAASVFSKVHIVGVVGDDFPISLLNSFKERGIDTQGIERAPGKTFRWRGRYSHDLLSRITLETHLNVFSQFSPTIPESARHDPLILLGNIHPRLQQEVLNQLIAPHMVIVDTMNFWIAQEPTALNRLLEKTDVLVINEEETRELSGIHNLVKAAKNILKRGPKQLIIKRGEHSALLFDQEDIFFVPAYPLEDVLDPTGAGDAFAGGLIGYLATCTDISSSTLREGMYYATALASFCVEGIGTERLLAISTNNLIERTNKLKELVLVHR
ncbi:PfkB family carbohydrate kinase [Pajaroellobacter abortibovis]|uniref:Sugar kinase n=1 Tax=Pajaroellobacter abortibovis TaxID=1882918 RepID=A0A1L6MX86_9BACT|nr:PfkB family carbohydrate kinase [Pajaroellobacter abortibovis]APS00191.1 sugar kinase [Pajaroellobacter abortibovis]